VVVRICSSTSYLIVSYHHWVVSVLFLLISHRHLPGLTRQSIFNEEMDSRVEPAHDTRVRRAVLIFGGAPATAVAGRASLARLRHSEYRRFVRSVRPTLCTPLVKPAGAKAAVESGPPDFPTCCPATV